MVRSAPLGDKLRLKWSSRTLTMGLHLHVEVSGSLSQCLHAHQLRGRGENAARRPGRRLPQTKMEGVADGVTEKHAGPE